MSQTPVLVVGAGPAGLIAALSLAKSGIKARIIDKANEFHTGSRGFGMQPRTFELLQTLGCLPDVFALATPTPTMRAYKIPENVPVKTWDLYKHNDFQADRPLSPGRVLSQSVLEEVFRKHLAKHDITVELGSELVGFEQSATSVSATIMNHSTGHPEVSTYQYVIAADGAKGPCRKLLGLTFQGETRDADGQVWGDVEIGNLTSDYWHIWAKPGFFTIMARPLSSTGKIFGIGITGQNFDPTDLADSEKCKDFFKRETSRTDLVFKDFSWLSYFKPNMRIVNKFRVGRIFVAGDAGHCHSPSGGQGMNCSVQDASNLAWKLALVIRGLSPSSILDSYEDERLPVISQMLRATSQLYTHMVAKDQPDSGDGQSSGFMRWRNDALELYGVNYRWSDIVLDERTVDASQTQTLDEMKARGYEGYDGSVKAGDRAPDVALVNDAGVSTSLFESLKFEVHTVVVFAASRKSVEEVVDAAANKLPQGLVQVVGILSNTVDPIPDSGLFKDAGEGRATYHVDDGIVVVRPDGFIGAIANDVSGVLKYFSKIFV